jgi:hypothetical protein
VFSFPIVFNDVEAAIVTLVKMFSFSEESKENMMRKYLGHTDYESSWYSYMNQNTYSNCYLTFKVEELELPEKAEHFYLYESSFKDREGQEVKYRLSYGIPEDDALYHEYIENTRNFNAYRFDNSMTLQIEDKEIKGDSLGEKINENIKQRIKNYENN